MHELAAAGVRLLLSVPNSRTFHEDNEFHLTDFGYDEARAAFDRFDPDYLFQHIAEGSVIVGSDRPEAFSGEVGALERAEPEYANTFLVAVGFGSEAVREATAHVNLVATPNHNRYMLELAASNAELFRTNLRLSEGWMGKSDAAAAATQDGASGLREQLSAAQARVQELEAIARHNDILYQREHARLNAPRYRAVDKLRDAVAAIPLLGRVLRWGWRRIGAVRGR
jgi:hypothetical protein